MASCQATRTSRVAETLVGARSAGWPAPIQALQNGTIVANPRRRRGAGVASFRCVGWRDLPTHRCVGCRSVLGSGDHVFTLVSEDLEGFVEDRTQLGKDRASANPPSFVVLDLWLRDIHPIPFPIDVVPAKRQRFRRRPTLLGKPMHET